MRNLNCRPLDREEFELVRRRLAEAAEREPVFGFARNGSGPGRDPDPTA
jgi:hypothetical protein